MSTTSSLATKKTSPCNNFRPQLWRDNVCRDCFCTKERHGPKAMLEEKLGANHLNERDPEEIFEIMELLGTGSYGDVYLGRNIDTNEMMALKFIPLQKADEQEVTTIVNEINIIRETFECPFIVEYHGVYMKEQTIMVVMEYCVISVEDILNFCPEITFTEDEIAAICAAVIKALAFLHAYKICHRDIKSGNILLKPNGEVRIADFGISHKLQDGKEKMNTLAGSPYWCSPELITHSSYTNKVDIWATGIVAIELAERRPPHWDMEPMQVIFHIPKQPPPTLKEKEKWSPEFHNFLELCLKKDANDRPAARDLLAHPFILQGSSHQILQSVVEKAVPLASPRKRESLKDELEKNQDILEPVATGTVVAVDKTSKTIKSTILLEPGATTKFETFKMPEDQCLFFGVALDASLAYCERRKVRHPILHLLQHIKDNCLHADGLFRVSGQQSRVDELRLLINNAREYNLLLYNSHDIANAVKQYLRELPDPLLTAALYDKIVNTHKIEFEQRIGYMKIILSSLPLHNRKLLKMIIEICYLLSKNNSSAASSAILLGPCLLWKKTASEATIIADTTNVNKFVQLMIENYQAVFN